MTEHELSMPCSLQSLCATTDQELPPSVAAVEPLHQPNPTQGSVSEWIVKPVLLVQVAFCRGTVGGIAYSYKFLAA